ncbi:MAG TPA: hypothetical protein PK867_03015 [Pirellulales bacterium]|nr:hypothetical protein [Pirellulales bacterium]
MIVDAAQAPWVVLANALVAWSAWRLSGPATSDERLPQRLLRAVLVWVAAIVLIATILGACGVLYGWALAVAGALFSIVAARLVREGKHGHLAAASGHVANRSHKGPEESPVAWGQAMWAGWCVLLALLVGHVVVNGLLVFPEEFDALAYHIPLIDHWLQASSLYAPDAASWWTSGNAEVVGLWMVAPFSGDFLIALGNLPFIVLWVLAALETGRLAGLAVIWRHLSVAAMLIVHTTFHEADKAMNDLAVAACFFAAVAYGFRYFEAKGSWDLTLAGIAIGLLAGVKYFALGYAALAAGVLFAGTALASGWRDAARATALLTLTALPFCGYWYLRNYLMTGHPLYPQGADSRGIGYPYLWGTTLAGNGTAEVAPLAGKALWTMTGPCHLFAVAAAPFAAISLAWAGANRLRRGGRAEAAILLALCALLVGTGAVLAITPFCVEDQPGTLNHLRWAYTPARYGLCFLSMAALAAAWVLQRGSEKAASWCARRFGAPPVWQCAITFGCRGIVAAGIVWQVYLRVSYLHDHSDLRAPPDLLGAAVVGFYLALAAWLAAEFWRAKLRHRRTFAAATVISLLVGASVGVGALSRHWHAGYARHFDALRGTTVFTRLAKEPTRTIVVLDHRPYPFFGSARQHRVCSPRILTSYEDLIAKLQASRADIVASPPRNTGAVFDRYKQGPEWLRTHGSQFKLVMTTRDFSLFTFQGSAPPTADVTVNAPLEAATPAPAEQRSNARGRPRRPRRPVKRPIAAVVGQSPSEPRGQAQ